MLFQNKDLLNLSLTMIDYSFNPLIFPKVSACPPNPMLVELKWMDLSLRELDIKGCTL